MKKAILAILVLLLVVAVVPLAWYWVVCYNWCDYGTSVLVTRKTGEMAAPDEYSREGQKGVLKEMLGPGRHFLNPWDFSVTPVKDVRIEPGKIALVKNNVGKNLPSGRFLAAPDEKGTQKTVLTPGLWRVNPFGQTVETADATFIPPGYVGVVLLREGPDKGVQPDVLQPGYYHINPLEKRVDIVEIGVRVLELHAGSGTPISFPLADGKEMVLDFTAVHAIYPENAPEIIRNYGNVEDILQKVIIPQVLSICKNAGSNLTTKEFIEGETRQRFQEQVQRTLQEIGREKGIDFVEAAVRGFHASEDIKAEIQARRLAEEEKDTLAEEQKRDTVAALLEQAERMVDVAIKDFDAETEALVREIEEQGNKKAAETRAEADRGVAAKLKLAAQLDANRIRIMGRAEAEVKEKTETAKADLFRRLVEAVGGAEAYNRIKFAENLPEDIRLEYRYSGPGTLWTEGGLEETAAKKILEQSAP
ncbi:MAG: SPFH domain-containing protein [Planctomycetota bacterium]